MQSGTIDRDKALTLLQKFANSLPPKELARLFPGIRFPAPDPK